MKKEKVKAMIAKCQKVKKRMSLSNKKEENYRNDTVNEIDPD